MAFISRPSTNVRTSAFEQNITNPNAVLGTNSRPPGTPNPFTDGNATIVDIETANSRAKAAQDAEKKWMTETLGADINDSRKTNKIKLVSTKVSSGDGNNTGYDSVEFYISPDISESKQAIYAEIGDIRQAASLLIYTGSPSRKWSINAKLLARTPAEADFTWKQTQLLRSWMNPDSNYKYGIDASGTPHVLKFFGYGRTWQGIPVVITQLNIDYNTETDYVQTSYGTNVPMIQNISIQITEARTPDDLLKKFDLEMFKLGVLPEW